MPPEANSAAPDAGQAPPTLAELLDQISAAYRHKNYDLGLSLVKKAFELKQRTDVSSVDKIGSIYYAMGRYGEAFSPSGPGPCRSSTTRRIAASSRTPFS